MAIESQWLYLSHQSRRRHTPKPTNSVHTTAAVTMTIIRTWALIVTVANLVPKVVREMDKNAFHFRHQCTRISDI